MQETLYAPIAPAEETPPYSPASGDWMIMTETDPATIQAQIAAGVIEYGSPARFLNNLADNLPGGRRRDRDQKYATKRPDMFSPNSRQNDPNKWSGWDWAAHSRRMSEATRSQFNSDMEAAIADAAQDPKSGITRENLVALNQSRAAGTLSQEPDVNVPKLSDTAQKAFAENGGNLEEAFAVYLLPLYARLREEPLGYSHYDLFQ